MVKSSLASILLFSSLFFYSCAARMPVATKVTTTIEERPRAEALSPAPLEAETRGETMAVVAPPPASGAVPPPPSPEAKAKAMLPGRLSRHPSAATPPRSPGVKAGAADDNKQFNYFLGFLKKFEDLDVYKLDVTDRIVFTMKDEHGKSLPNCMLTFQEMPSQIRKLSLVTGRITGGKIADERRTYADGRAMFFPSEHGCYPQQNLLLKAACEGRTIEKAFDCGGEKTVEVTFPFARRDYSHPPLDIAFLFDTTGSMRDELDRLKSTLEVIHFQIAQFSSQPDVRFGMVLYKDVGDEYRTKVIQFTSNFDAFHEELKKVEAEGGGDEPEDVQEGLQRSMNELDWRQDAVRLLFLIGDAPPHLDYGQPYTYIHATHDAARKGIKITAIGASGLPVKGEYIFRQISQYTMGIFVFLTYGEKGESEGGTTGTVSHHTGENWQSENLDAIVVRMVKRELSHLTDKPVGEGEEYFETVASGDADRDAVLSELFGQSIQQLIDYSVIKIEDRTPTVVFPVSVKDPGLKPASELLEDRLLLKLFGIRPFQILERKDMNRLLDEMRLQLSDLFDSKGGIKVGNMVGAKLAMMSKLSRGREKLEMLLKLVRVETGEVLSVALLKIDNALLPIHSPKKPR